jgi:autonomous glycyl radical cofactor GrcA
LYSYISDRVSTLTQFDHLHEAQLETLEHLVQVEHLPEVQVEHLPEVQVEQPAQLNFNVTFAVSFCPYLLIAV